MWITIERSGGFAGIKKSTSIDTNDLAPDHAVRVVEAANQLATAGGKPAAGAA